MFYTFCYSQQSDQGLLFAILGLIRFYTDILSSLIKVYTTWHSWQSDHIQSLHCHSQEQPDLGLHYMPFSAVWSGSTLFAILSILI